MFKCLCHKQTTHWTKNWLCSIEPRIVELALPSFSNVLILCLLDDFRSVHSHISVCRVVDVVKDSHVVPLPLEAESKR